MNQWMQQKQEQIEKLGHFNSESFLSSDSGLYYDDSDDASQAAGSAANHHAASHQFRHPVIDQSSGKTKQS